MTRLAVLADIHGNLPALEAVIADMQQFQPDHVVVAGDVINTSPFSMECIDTITQHGWAVIRGNHEAYVLDFDTPRADPRWRNGDPVQWTFVHMLNADLRHTQYHATIACWPDTLSLCMPDAPPLRVVHARLTTHRELILPTMPDEQVIAFFHDVPETAIITAHSHQQLHRRINGKLIVNPGAVGISLDAGPTASYAILDSTPEQWEVHTFRRVPYDIQALKRGYVERGYLERGGPIARIMLTEVLTGHPRINPFLRWKAEVQPDAPITFALVDQFLDLIRTDQALARRLYEMSGYSYRPLPPEVAQVAQFEGMI